MHQFQRARSVFDTQVAWSVLKDALGNTGMVGLAPLLSHYGAPDGSGEDMVKIKHDLSQVLQEAVHSDCSI